VRFLWPHVLLGFALLPLMVGGYVWGLRRPSRERIRYPALDLAAQAAATGRAWRRHLPATLYVSTFCGMIFTLARPFASIPLPDNRTAVMLSIDVSASMSRPDVRPTRLDAAKQAAIGFVQALPRGANVGLVAFSSYATLVSPPTTDHDRIIVAIRHLTLESSTAIGDGLLEAVYALPGRSRPEQNPMPTAAPIGAASEQLPPAAVVLLSDGGNNTGTDPYDAALIARHLQVRVSTVGLGSPDAGSDGLDEATLKTIAAVTGGVYRRVGSAEALHRVYQELGQWVVWVRKPTEVTGLAAPGVAVLLISTIAISTFGIHRLR
jgi:Ca-activated chloride channel homolog